MAGGRRAPASVTPEEEEELKQRQLSALRAGATTRAVVSVCAGLLAAAVLAALVLWEVAKYIYG